MTAANYIALVIPVVFVVIGIFFFGWFKILKETNNLLKEQNTELKIANKELLNKHTENVKQLASMQGQIDVLKSIPLVNIDTTLQKLSEFDKVLADNIARLADTSDRILFSLEDSASELRKDTIARAAAVRDVKTDLQDDDDHKTRLVKNKEK